MLLALLRACSFRLENDAVAYASVGTWLGRSATSSGPCSPPSESLRLPSPTPTGPYRRAHKTQMVPRPKTPGRRAGSKTWLLIRPSLYPRPAQEMGIAHREKIFRSTD